ncbi:hypothetical protein B0H12DRAFT_750033 [Mycena haematopus]|nr:hypothetical protein B0H12DRAFT_750033 [Mycena haematopus]
MPHFSQNCLGPSSWRRISEGDLDFRWFTSTTSTKLELTRGGTGVSGAAQFIGILKNFPSLSDLTCTVKLQTLPAHSPLTFPNLRSLSLPCDFRSVPPICLLDFLTLPRLVRLHFTSSLRPDVLIPFISRSGCVVRDLKYEFRQNDLTSDIWEALKLFPEVETLDIALKIDFSYLPEGIDTDSEKAYSHSRRLLLKLQHLMVTYNGDAASTCPINYSDIIGILHRRREHADTAELKSLHLMINEYIDWDCYPGDTLAAEFCRLISTGLDFTIGLHGRKIWPNDHAST